MKLFLGTDHAGFTLKEALKAHLTAYGHQVVDLGADTFVEGDSYLDYIPPAARCVTWQAPDAEQGERAIIFGGSGQGEAMAANRLRGVRAFVYYGAGLAKNGLDAHGTSGEDGYDIVRLSRRHNNSNVLSFGARFIDEAEMKAVTDIWLATAFEGGRHADRVKALDTINDEIVGA